MTATALVERDFAVPDIRCAGCIAKLEQGLVRDRRIAAARVNFTEKRVHLSCTPDTGMPDLIGAFSSLGFEAHRSGAAPTKPMPKPKRAANCCGRSRCRASR